MRRRDHSVEEEGLGSAEEDDMLRQLKLLFQPGILFKVVLISVVVIANVFVIRRIFFGILNSESLRNSLQIIALYIPKEIRDVPLFDD